MTGSARLLDAFRGRRIAVVGEAILDAYVTGHVERLCREAPVPIVDVDAWTDAAGGAANAAVNVRTLGGDPIFVSVAGDDGEADRLRAALEASGVAADGIVSARGRRTLAKQRLLADGQMIVRFDAGTTTPIDADAEDALIDAIRAAHAEADALVVSDYGYGTVTDRVRAAIGELQRAHPIPLVVDARDLRRYRPLRPTAVKPNYGEAIRMLGEPEVREVRARATQVGMLGEKLLELTGARIVALTIDRDGALAFEAGRPPYRTYATPAASSRAAGAGDTFVATLALGLAIELDAPALVELASAAAAVVVAKDGTSTCTAEELVAALATVEGKRVDTISELQERIAHERAKGRRVVFTNGVFDILHRGHVTYLNRAKALADVLVVAVNDDASVRRLKGPERPINGLDDRLGVLEALSCVDVVVPFGQATPAALIEAVRPDIYVKGGDYTLESLPEAAQVERLGGEVRLLPFVADLSTTAIVRRVRESAPRASPRATEPSPRATEPSPRALERAKGRASAPPAERGSARDSGRTAPAGSRTAARR